MKAIVTIITWTFGLGIAGFIALQFWIQLIGPAYKEYKKFKKNEGSDQKSINDYDK